VLRLLQSLLCQTMPRERFEVIVVENGSAQLSDIGAMSPDLVLYVHRTAANMAAARNAGLSVASGKYVVFTDADCVADPAWLEELVKALEEGRHAAVGGRIEKFEPTTWTQRHGMTIVGGQLTLNYLPATGMPYVVGANAGFVAAAVRDVGGFDERFLSGNDVDLCYRLGLKGLRVGLAPGAVVYHEDRRGIGAHFHRFRHYAVYQVLLFAKYRHVSGRRFVLNPYPAKRLAQAISALPRATAALCHGNADDGMETVLVLVEAAGIWCGDIQGSIHFRQLYL